MERSDRPRLVVVEDGSRDPGSIALVAQLLGWEASRATSAQHALAELGERKADLLVTELILPNAFELILAAKRVYGVPSLIVTAARPSFSPDSSWPSDLASVIEKRGAWLSQLATEVNRLRPTIGAEASAESRAAEKVITEASTVTEALSELATLRWSETIRRPAIAALGERGRREAAPLIDELLRAERARAEPSSAVVEQITEQRLRWGAIDSGELIRMIHDTKTSMSARARALRSLEAISIEQASIEAQRLLDTGPLWLRIDAVESASRCDQSAILARAVTQSSLPESVRDLALERLLPQLDAKLATKLASVSSRWDLPSLVRGEGLAEMIDEARRAEDQSASVEILRRAAARYPRARVASALATLRREAPESFRISATQIAFELEAWRQGGAWTELAAESPGVQRAALLGLMRRPDIDGLLSLIESKLDASLRRLSIFVLGAQLDPRRGDEMLRAGVRHPDPIVREASLIQQARLGPRGLDQLEAWAIDDTLESKTRASAILLLGLRADLGAAMAAIRAALASDVELVRAAGFELAFSRLRPSESELLSQLESSSPECGYAALAGARDLGEAGFDTLRAIAESNRLAEPVRRAARAALRPEVSSAETVPRPMAVETARTLIEDIEDEFVPTVPEEPAAFIPELIDSPVSPSSRPAAIDKERASAQTPRELRRELDRAIALGAEGLGPLESLSIHRSAPIEVRTRAIKQLATSFSSPEAMPILLRLLADPSSTIQNEALGGAMYLGDMPIDELRRFATSKATAKIRARATRHLGARMSRETSAPILEALFEDKSTMVRKAALFALFPSLKHLEGSALEEGLVNLLSHHESASVKLSAVKALGVFGSARSLEALEGFGKGLFQEARLKEAAQEAAVRIRARYGSRA